VSAAVLGRMQTLRLYRSLLASMEMTVVSAESDLDAFEGSNYKCCLTARREENRYFNGFMQCSASEACDSIVGGMVVLCAPKLPWNMLLLFGSTVQLFADSVNESGVMP
jgi:hypothetical protein